MDWWERHCTEAWRFSGKRFGWKFSLIAHQMVGRENLHIISHFHRTKGWNLNISQAKEKKIISFHHSWKSFGVCHNRIYILFFCQLLPALFWDIRSQRKVHHRMGKPAKTAKPYGLRRMREITAKIAPRKNAKLVSEMESSAKYKKNIITCKILSNQHIVALKRKTMNRTIKDLDVN